MQVLIRRIVFAATLITFASQTTMGQVYVATGGNDGNDGSTPALAVQTIQRGINLASGTGEPVYVEAGTYTGDFDFANGIHLFGGFLPGFTGRNPTSNPTIVSRDHNGIRSDSVSDVVIDGMTFKSANAPSPGGSNQPGLTSSTLFFQSSSGIFISNCIFDAGKGSNGTTGFSIPSTGSQGGAGPLGQPGCEQSSGFGCDTCAQPQRGAGGAPNGAAGGNAGHAGNTGGLGSSFAGPTCIGVFTNGTPAGLGNWCPTVNYWGKNGLNGATGTPGSGAAGLGSFSLSEYVPAAPGGDGGQGIRGCGGGGGGGGGGTAGCDSYGGGGGGGGLAPAASASISVRTTTSTWSTSPRSR